MAFSGTKVPPAHAHCNYFNAILYLATMSCKGFCGIAEMLFSILYLVGCCLPISTEIYLTKEAGQMQSKPPFWQ